MKSARRSAQTPDWGRRRAAALIALGALAFLGASGAALALGAADAGAHDLMPRPARNPFDLGMREGGGPPTSGFAAWILAEQVRFERMLSGAVRAVRADAAAFWTLMGIGFSYGVFHAAGPGHGKVVVASYMLANERSLRRGVTISLLAALLQGVVAVTIVGILAAILNATAARMKDAAHFVEMASYAGVALLGAWLVWRKGRSLVQELGLGPARTYALEASAAPQGALAYAGAQGGAGEQKRQDQTRRDQTRRDQARRDQKRSAFVCADPGHVHGPGCGHFHAPSPDQLGDNFTWRGALATIFAAGLRPCSGAILVLVFALAQGVFFAGVAATFAMSLGTAITTGALASMAVLAKGLAVRFLGEGSSRGALAARLLEFAAAILILMVGVALLSGAYVGRGL
jgi:nickel/cobalt exporter